MARTDPRNRAHYWWDRQTPGMSLMRAQFTTQDYPPHVHDGLVIAATESGGSVVKSRGAVEEARSATLLVFNPDEPHAGSMGTSEHWCYRSFYLRPAALDAVAHTVGMAGVPYFNRNAFDDAELIEGFLTLHRALEDKTDQFRSGELLCETFGKLFQRHGLDGMRIEPAPRDVSLLKVVTAIIEDRYAEDLRLEDLSSVIGITPFQLIGLFKRVAGLTPHAYLTQVRLRHACSLLRRGEPIANVASDAGFYDQSALNRHFKRSFGITPMQFVRAAMA